MKDNNKNQVITNLNEDQPKIIRNENDGRNSNDPLNPQKGKSKDKNNEESHLIEGNNPGKITKTNAMISPNLFQDQRVIEGNDLQKDAYQRQNLAKIEEKLIELKDGCIFLFVTLFIILLCIVLIIVFAIVGGILPVLIPIPAVCIVVSGCLLTTFVTIRPNEALVLTYYGQYMGTCKDNGFFWTRPCSDKKIVPLKSNQYNGNMLKVNDRDGNPVLIGIVAVWKIRDTAKVVFGVTNFENFVGTQAESAIRFVACKYPYEAKSQNEPCLKGNNEEINQLLKIELERRIHIAGIEIEDARITEISYGHEIASVMLKKQVAAVTVQAKERIAVGSVDIIEKSIKELEKRKVCDLKNDEKTKLVSNMMVILNMGDHSSSTLINV